MEENTIVLDVALPEEAEVRVVDLQKELLVLRLAFGQLKAAIVDAAGPLMGVLTPALTGAVRIATRFVKSLGQVIAALLGVRIAQSKTVRTVVSGGKAVKRSLAGFDQLNRLQGSSGGGSVSTQQVPVEVTATLSPAVQRVVDTIMALIEPLRTIDLFPAQWGLARLADAFMAFAATAGEVLTQLWHQVLVPVITWVVEELAPVLLNLATQALKYLSVALGDAGAGFLEMMEKIRPVTEFLGTLVVAVLQTLGQVFQNLTQSVETDGSCLGNVFRNVGTKVEALWQFVGPVLENIRQLFAGCFQSAGQEAEKSSSFIVEALTGAVRLVTGLVTGDWKTAWNGMGTICKSSVNMIIGLLNGMLKAFASAINGVFKKLNQIKVTVPDWVPGLGGRSFGFSFSAITAPQIPYLAKGAVLPANKPFLAMVGDQKHGTNIEAPLATIQEAVAVTMEDLARSNLAGHQATVEVLRQILQAVLGIHIGDGELYRAVERYRDKRAVMTGTGW